MNNTVNVLSYCRLKEEPQAKKSGTFPDSWLSFSWSYQILTGPQCTCPRKKAK